MILQGYQANTRKPQTKDLEADLVVIGGGMSGVCAAITAARAGVKVILVQDRPVLGGNASSEVRLWILGATSHMGNNNRWSREGGVINEILLENLYRNKEGNPLILDTVLLEKVTNEKNIQLLLNTSVHEVIKKSEREIDFVKAFCSQNSTEYRLKSHYFCDASGDGVVAFLSGAAFRMGAEKMEEFGEKFAPDESYGELLGHSLYFYSKRAEKPVKYVPPAYALKNIEEIPRYKILNEKDYGCRLWWIEYGGRKDTIHDTEEIKWELWKVVYGVWDYIKNSGNFEDTENLTLEWVGTIPGKRESRRFEGLYMMKQQDVVEQRTFEDAVAFGGWSLDLHPADGLYTSRPGCNQWHSKGVYQLPLRSFISKDIDNLFLAGRIISASHVAFGSTRVMGTCAHGAQAVGEAAALCMEKGMLPKQILENGSLKVLQQRLNFNGQSIPGIAIDKSKDLTSSCTLKASSTLVLSEIPFDGDWQSLEHASAQLLPLKKGECYTFSVMINAEEETSLCCELQTSLKAHNYTPDRLIEQKEIRLKKGQQRISIAFSEPFPSDQYGFLLFRSNDKVAVLNSQKRATGIISVFQKSNKAVSNNGMQQPDRDIGVDAFEFWTPGRRPEGQNLAMTISPALHAFDVSQINNGFVRPYEKVNGWVSDWNDKDPSLELEWDHEVTVSSIRFYWDCDYDHAMESSLMDHPEDIVPFIIQEATVMDCSGKSIASVQNNYQGITELSIPEGHRTKKLKIALKTSNDSVPASLFEISIR
ncbi:hypothetical protein GCM10028791_26280 [Echinicola sediminis]